MNYTFQDSLVQNGSESSTHTNSFQAFGYTLALCGASILALEVLFFVLATVLKSDKVKDVAGGCAFTMVALLSLFVNVHQNIMVTMDIYF